MCSSWWWTTKKTTVAWEVQSLIHQVKSRFMRLYLVFSTQSIASSYMYPYTSGRTRQRIALAVAGPTPLSLTSSLRGASHDEVSSSKSAFKLLALFKAIREWCWTVGVLLDRTNLTLKGRFFPTVCFQLRTVSKSATESSGSFCIVSLSLSKSNAC